jgi:hypothetical protein
MMVGVEDAGLEVMCSWTHLFYPYKGG